MVQKRNFLTLTLRPGLLCEHDDGNFVTLVFGFTLDSKVDLPDGYTHFGVVVEGTVLIQNTERERILQSGDFFSVVGPATVKSNGTGMLSSAKGYKGLNICGGPLESTGRLRYIDGCSDTLLVPPVRKGDPCLNHLHFPPGIAQTPHTHPSVRTGIVYRGSGDCILPDESNPVPLISGHAFVIRTGAIHSFNTRDETMDVIAFHPDSDTGMTDDDHPMVNRTMVGGVSARFIDGIRTQIK